MNQKPSEAMSGKDKKQYREFNPFRHEIYGGGGNKGKGGGENNGGKNKGGNGGGGGGQAIKLNDGMNYMTQICHYINEVCLAVLLKTLGVNIHKLVEWLIARARNYVRYKCSMCDKRRLTFCSTMNLGWGKESHRYRICKKCCNCDEH
ncbi:hypothetical protein DdX_10108 [Ditylenchus destructor]|uniref:Uncharacterized protein n=1 Tax=Ditylenchus destructor TaxID=166010 RepID=A0AAD4MZV6_9BILA|nr:hypothetical protein DdX_10108 [Ditylenchus destructor]